MGVLGNTVGDPVVGAILPVAPFQSIPVQLDDVPEHTTYQEVLLGEATKPLHLAFGKKMPGLTELRPETNRFREHLIDLLSDDIVNFGPSATLARTFSHTVTERSHTPRKFLYNDICTRHRVTCIVSGE